VRRGARAAVLAGAAAVVAAASALLPQAARAEVIQTHASGFIVRHEAVVEADPKATWLALISPDGWWSKEHTWSGDAANLAITPSAGGCFCERIPEVDEPGRFTLEGSVEHMRVIQAYPESALRMRGALGPLQSEPVTGVLTITISRTDSGSDSGSGTRLVWEYNVAGYMRYEIPVISRAVDGVIGLQAEALGKKLGLITFGLAKKPAAKPDAPTGTGGATGAATGTAAGAKGPGKAGVKPGGTPAPAPALAPAAAAVPAAAPAKPAAAQPKPAAAPPKPAATKPKVDEAFSDLIGD
jgi:hypothetical protein